VVSAIASALSLKDSGDGSLIKRVKETFTGRSVLLVLDNFEQVVSAAPLLAELLNSNNDGLKILVTSRVTLRLKAETMYVLPPLQIPAASDRKTRFAEISRCEAVSLFVERAKQAQPMFELAPENAGDVASICTQVGGLPLAIELAAARMKVLSPEAVRIRLKKQLDVLQGITRDAPPRQQTMRETIAWSFDLLTDREKQIFARLGVFSGGFELEAGEFICSDLSGESTVSALDVITSLVEHNLLAANARNGKPRIYMLEVVREFAEEILAGRGEVEKTRSSHAEYFLQLGEEAERNCWPRDRPNGLNGSKQNTTTCAPRLRGRRSTTLPKDSGWQEQFGVSGGFTATFAKPANSLMISCPCPVLTRRRGPKCLLERHS
jgi:predicted ATPase